MNNLILSLLVILPTFAFAGSGGTGGGTRPETGFFKDMPADFVKVIGQLPNGSVVFDYKALEKNVITTETMKLDQLNLLYANALSQSAQSNDWVAVFAAKNPSDEYCKKHPHVYECISADPGPVRSSNPGCFTTPCIPGPSDPDGSLCTTPVPREWRCN